MVDIEDGDLYIEKVIYSSYIFLQSYIESNCTRTGHLQSNNFLVSIGSAVDPKRNL